MAEHYIIDGKEHVYESAAEKHLTDKTITENGTYSAEDEPGDINGYKEVVVNVEGGGGTVTKTVYTTVTGGYNGGAVIAITIDEEVVFTATAIDTYNKNYNITHDVIYTSGSPVIIDIIPPETNTSALGISIEGNNTIQYSVMPNGANTSYGYNFSDSDSLTVGGGGSTLVEKTITENGTYNPSDDNADGYSQVSVNVPNEYVDSPVNDYAFDYDPNNTATTVKSGGFLFTCKRACKVTKIRVYGVSTEAKVFISNVNGTTLASGTSNQVIENQWNDVELDSPIDLFEDTEYVVWYSQNGVLLKYKNFFGSLYSDYISYKKGMYSQLADTFPSNAENGNAYSVDLYIDSIKVIKTAELITKQVTQNGTYNASDDSADGYSHVTVDVEGSGIPLISKADWDELTTEEKQAYGLVAVQENDTGYIRGLLVSGEDYVDLFRIEQLNGISSTSRYNVIPVPDMDAVEFVFNDVESFGGMILSINPNIGTCNVKFELLSSTATVQFGNCTPGASLPGVISQGTNRKSYSTYSPYSLLSIDPQNNNLFMGIYAPGGSYRMRISVSHPS